MEVVQLGILVKELVGIHRIFENHYRSYIRTNSQKGISQHFLHQSPTLKLEKLKWSFILGFLLGRLCGDHRHPNQKLQRTIVRNQQGEQLSLQLYATTVQHRQMDLHVPIQYLAHPRLVLEALQQG